MARTVKLALIQQKATQDISQNIQKAVAAFETAAQNGAQLIAFAELAFTPFYPQQIPQGEVQALAETVPGPTTEVFQDLAKKWGVVTVINLFEKDGDHTYDSSPVIDADGTVLGVTRMVHILEAPCFHEQHYYTPGPGAPIVFDTQVGKVGVAICYDRHYPEYMRALALQGAEIVIVPQAGAVGEWPEGLYEAELQVAAFQNGYFAALCNRVGVEACITFEGKSFVVSPSGQLVAQAPPLKDAILYAEIDLDLIPKSHAQKHFLKDRRPEMYSKWFN